MNRVRLIVFAVAVCCLLARRPGHAQRIVRDVDFESIVDKAIVIDTVTLKRVREIAHHEISVRRQTYKLLRITMADDPHVLMNSLGHYNPRPSVEDSISALVKHGRPMGPVAQLIATSKGAVIALNDGRSIVETIIAGADPRSFLAGDMEFTLLHFHLAGNPTLAPKSRLMTAYFTTRQDLSVSGVVKLMRTLSLLAEPIDVTVRVARDPWFLDDPHYPLVNRFVRMPNVPSKLEYLARGRISCSASAQAIRCSGQNLVP